MTDLSIIDQIAQRVERLVLRYEEFERTNATLLQDIVALERERDSLKSRLNAARARNAKLLDRLPTASRPAPARTAQGDKA